MYEAKNIINKPFYIHCPTFELAKKVNSILAPLWKGYPDDSKLSNNWNTNKYKDQFCFAMNYSSFTYSYLGYAKADITIISAEDFIRDNSVKQQFKIGDRVKCLQNCNKAISGIDYSAGWIELGKEYTVSQIGNYKWKEDVPSLTLKEANIWIPQCFFELVNSSGKMVYTKDNIVGIHFEAGQSKSLYKVIEIKGDYTYLSEFRKTGGWQPKFQSSQINSFLKELNTGINWIVVDSPIQEDNEDIKVGDEVELFQHVRDDKNYYVNSPIGSKGIVVDTNKINNNKSCYAVKREGKSINSSWIKGDVRKVGVVNNINKQTIKQQTNENQQNSSSSNDNKSSSRGNIVKILTATTEIRKSKGIRATSVSGRGCISTVRGGHQRNKQVSY